MDRSASLAGAIVAAYPVTLPITSREAGPVNFTEVAEACLLEVVRALGIKALRLLTIVPAGFETLLVTPVRSRVGTAKDVLTVAKIIAIRIVAIWIPPEASIWTIESRITPNND